MRRNGILAGLALGALALPAQASASACPATWTSPSVAATAGVPVQIVGVVTRVRVDAIRVVHGRRSLRFAVTTALLPCRFTPGTRVQAVGVRVGRALLLTSLTRVHHRHLQARGDDRGRGDHRCTRRDDDRRCHGRRTDDRR